MHTLIAAVLLAISAAAAATDAAPYQLDATEVRDVPAPALRRDYQLFVALPDSYGTGARRYPVLFVTDANYAFPIVRGIAQRLHRHAGMEEAIVVGLSYARGDSGVHSRRRDYTPTVPRNHAYRPDMPGRAPAFGEAAAYGRYLTGTVLPFVAKHYRADLQRTVFIGHSYGSLLGLQVMFDQPGAFQHFILGSPSLWFDRGVMFGREQAYAAGHKDLPGSVYVGIGSTETLAPGRQRDRSGENTDMLADARDFQRALAGRRYPGLALRLEVFHGEDHASVFPFLLTHGLRTYLRKTAQ